MLIGAFLVLFILLPTLLLILFQRKLFYHPYSGCSNTTRSQPSDFGIKYENVRIKTSDGVELDGWFLKQSDTKQRPTILFFHGNAGNLTTRLKQLVQMFNSSLKPNLVVFSYRGYGLSGPGKISQKNLMSDAKAILNWCVQEEQMDRLIVYGKSLGGAVALQALVTLGYQEHVDGLVLENTFSSVEDLIFDYTPFFIPRWFISRVLYDKWRSKDLIGNVTIPTLMISSEKDELIDAKHMHNLRSSFNEDMQLFFLSLPHSRHNNAFLADAKLFADGFYLYFYKTFGSLKSLKGFENISVSGSNIFTSEDDS
ncbi:hypothetical protein PCE1_001305 [Barthelona sp. PCE]